MMTNDIPNHILSLPAQCRRFPGTIHIRTPGVSRLGSDSLNGCPIHRCQEEDVDLEILVVLTIQDANLKGPEPAGRTSIRKISVYRVAVSGGSFSQEPLHPVSIPESVKRRENSDSVRNSQGRCFVYVPEVPALQLLLLVPGGLRSQAGRLRYPARDHEMDNAAVEQLRKRFLKFVPDFTSFPDAPERLQNFEIGYKRQAAAKVRSTLDPYVRGEEQFATDDEARVVLMGLIKTTNLTNWRDNSYIEDQLLAEEGDWLRFAGLLVACLREIPNADWQTPLANLLQWLEEKDCRASITKILPTYFLFLWDSHHHFCIKSRFADRLLKEIGEESLGDGQPLTVDRYRHVLESLERLGEALADWQPRDNTASAGS